MSRGEEQKPVTDSYRSNWDAIFGSARQVGKTNAVTAAAEFMAKNGELLKRMADSEKAPPVKTEPCDNCGGSGFEPGHDYACTPCGGCGVIPLET